MVIAQRERAREAAFWAAVTLCTTALTLYLFRDHLGGLRHRLLGPHNDVIQNFWMLRAQWSAILELRFGEIFAAPSMAPEAPALAFGDTLFAPMLTGLPFAALGEPELGFNAALLSTYLVCAICAAGLARSLTGSRAIGLCIGLAFAFFPKRLQNFYHLNNLAFGWSALAAWAIVAWHRQRSWRWIAIGVAAVYLQFLSSIQLTFHLALFVALWAAALGGRPLIDRLRGRREGIGLGAREGRQLIAAAAALALLLAPWAALYGPIRATLPGARATDAMFFYRAHLADWGERLFPGWVVVIGLALALGLWGMRLNRRWRERWRPPGVGHLGLLLGVSALAFALSFGPYTRIDGEVVPLPYYGLMKLVPIFGSLRVPHRLQRIAMIWASGAAALGLLWLSLLLRRWLGRFATHAVAAVAIAGLVATLGPIATGTRAQPKAAMVAQLRARLAPEAVIFPLPLSTHHGDRPQIDSLALDYDRRTIGGYNQGIPALFPVLRRYTDTFPAPEAAAAVRAVGATHLLVRRGRLSPGQRRDLEATAGPATFSGGSWQLFALGDGAPRGFDPMTDERFRLAGPSRAPAGERVTFALWPNVEAVAIDRLVRRDAVATLTSASGTELAARAVLHGPSVVAPAAEPYRIAITTPHRPGRYTLRLLGPTGVAPATTFEVVPDLATSFTAPLGRVSGGALELPERIYAGAHFPVRLELRNVDQRYWLATSEHQLPANRGAVVVDSLFSGPQRFGRRYQPAHGFVALPHDLAPGDGARLFLQLEAPRRPGDYQLRLTIASQHHTPLHRGLVLADVPVTVR